VFCYFLRTLLSASLAFLQYCILQQLKFRKVFRQNHEINFEQKISINIRELHIFKSKLFWVFQHFRVWPKFSLFVQNFNFSSIFFIFGQHFHFLAKIFYFLSIFFIFGLNFSFIGPIFHFLVQIFHFLSILFIFFGPTFFILFQIFSVFGQCFFLFFDKNFHFVNFKRSFYILRVFVILATLALANYGIGWSIKVLEKITKKLIKGA